MAGAVAFVLKGYPRLSETFIAQEIEGLEKLGLDIRIYSMRPPRERQRHPVHDRIDAPVTYLPERLRDDPARVARALIRQFMKPGFWKSVGILLGEFFTDPALDLLHRYNTDREIRGSHRSGPGKHGSPR